jgi:hypothetical protein
MLLVLDYSPSTRSCTTPSCLQGLTGALLRDPTPQLNGQPLLTTKGLRAQLEAYKWPLLRSDETWDDVCYLLHRSCDSG